MLYFIAAGIKIDTDKAERFGKQIDRVYKNPFETPKAEPQTAEEIKQRILTHISDLLHGG